MGQQGMELIATRWVVSSNFQLHTSGWVIYKFENEEDRERIFLGRPYFVFVIPLFLKIMPRCFLFADDG